MPGWAIAVAAVALALLTLDRAVARGWFDGWRVSLRSGREVDGRGTGGGLLGDLTEVFQPNAHHLVAEQERQRLDIVREGDAGPPRDRTAPDADTQPTVP